MEKVKETFGEDRAILKLVAITLLLSVLVGCAKPHTLPNIAYEVKQVQQAQRGSLETTYVICRGCVQYTKLNKNK